MDILERLSEYNPPDRVNDEAREIAIDIQDAKNEIERLRWENANMEKLWGKSEATWMEIRDKQDAEIERLLEANETIVVLNEQANNEVYWLEQEIERLREALTRCADLSEKWEDSLVSQINLIAHSALQQKDSE